MAEESHRYCKQWKGPHCHSVVQPRNLVPKQYRHSIITSLQSRPVHSLGTVSYACKASEVLTWVPEKWYPAFSSLLPESEISPPEHAEHDFRGCRSILHVQSHTLLCPVLYACHKRGCCRADTSLKGLLVSTQAEAGLFGCKRNSSS